MEFIKTKSILSKVKQGNLWLGTDYNMNLYRGCSHGCIYCDSRSNCYHIEEFDRVRGKENALTILEQELIRKREKGVIGIGAMSDTYNPFEKIYEQTRNALKLIAKYNFGVSIDTKSDLIKRDLDILKEINDKNNVIVKFTITTPEDALCKRLEPNVCVTSKRLEAIKVLSDNGIFVGILLNPVLPFITDKEEDIVKLVKLAHEFGAKFIYSYMGMTLRENERDYYYEQLNKKFPGLKEKYRKTFGEKQECNPPNDRRLWEVLKRECEKYGILYNMQEIIAAYKNSPKTNEQLSLFEE